MTIKARTSEITHSDSMISGALGDSEISKLVIAVRVFYCTFLHAQNIDSVVYGLKLWLLLVTLTAIVE